MFYIFVFFFLNLVNDFYPIIHTAIGTDADPTTLSEFGRGSSNAMQQLSHIYANDETSDDLYEVIVKLF